MPRKNDWQQRFGASRWAKDRAYCAAAERAIAAEERAGQIDRYAQEARVRREAIAAREAMARAVSLECGRQLSSFELTAARIEFRLEEMKKHLDKTKIKD